MISRYVGRMAGTYMYLCSYSVSDFLTLEYINVRMNVLKYLAQHNISNN